MNLLNLIFTGLQDRLARDNFQRIQDFLKRSFFVSGQFKPIELEFKTNVTNRRIRHGLGFKPNAAWQVWKEGTGTLTLNYSEWTDEEIDVSTSGTATAAPLQVTIYVGRH